MFHLPWGQQTAILCQHEDSAWFFHQRNRSRLMNPSPRRINIPTQQCSLKQCSLNSPTTPKFILSVSPVNCNLTGMQYFINPHTALSTLPTSTKISHLPTPPATRVYTSRVSHLIFRTLILPTPSSDPLHPSYQFTLAQKSPSPFMAHIYAHTDKMLCRWTNG